MKDISGQYSITADLPREIGKDVISRGEHGFLKENFDLPIEKIFEIEPKKAF